jgi:cupin 2 domain-containing protein
MKKNLFDDIPDRALDEILEDLHVSESVRIERIVSFGQSSPEGSWYEQEDHEWVLVLGGSATLGFDDGTSVDLAAGDHLDIPAGCRHRVERTTADRRTVWLAVFHRG